MGRQLLFALCMAVCVKSWVALAVNEELAGDDVSVRVRREAEDMAARTARRRCVRCEVNGKKYEGHSRFEYEDGCTKFRCICQCDGSYQCPAQYSRNICEENGNTGNRRSSSASGSSSSSHTASGHSSSSSGGSSSSSVHSSSQESRHESGSSSSSGHSSSQGSRRTGGSSSSQGSRRTGGSSSSQGSRRTGGSSSSQGSRRTGGGCASCTVGGQSYRGNSYFDHREGCIKYSNCVCYCNGTWVCPPSRAQNVCAGSGSSTGSRESSRSETNAGTSQTNSASGSQSSSSSGSRGRQGNRGCQDCNAKGTIAKGNAYFELKDGCTEFKYCVCRCDGSWTCPARFAKNVCEGEQATNSGQSQTGSSSSAVTGNRESTGSKCSVCTVRDQVFRPNTQFQVRDGCVLYSQCQCFCNGSWSCPETAAREVCTTGESSGVGGSSANCKTCEVKGRTFAGNSNFKITDGCIKYDNCICRCDGSWKCPAESASNICTSGVANSGRGSSNTGNSQITNSQNSGSNSGSSQSNSQTSSSHSSNTNSQSSSSSSQSSSTNIRGSSNSNQGSRTSSKGSSTSNQGSSTSNQGSSTSQQGSSTSNQGSSTSQRGSSSSNQGSSTSQHGSSTSNQASNTNSRGSVTNVKGSSSNVDSTTCRPCQVRGVSHRGNSFFEMRQDCILYENCVCHCNGSWSCPGASARNVCTDQNTNGADNTQCRSCDVYGKSFAPNKSFEVRFGCLEYKDCTCQCNGSWACPSTSAQNVCERDRVDSTRVNPASTSENRCASCLVYGKHFRGNSYFDITNGCMSWKNCACRCDGSWVCNRRQATNICGNGTATIGTDFTGSSSRHTATGASSETSSHTKTSRGTSSHTGTSRETHSQSNSSTSSSRQTGHSSNTGSSSSSSRDRGTSLGRDGSASTSNTGENIRTQSNTRTGGGAGTSRRIGSSGSNRCAFCQAKNKVVPGKTQFKLTDGCIEYNDCVCHCDGSWNCPAQSARNICTDGSQTGPSRATDESGCTSCRAKGKIVKGNTLFDLLDGCYQYSDCRCNCDGSWECFPEKARDICNTSPSRKDGCSMCQSHDGSVHPPNSKFKLVDKCIEYNCNCHCNGSWTCPGKDSRWVCTDKCLDCQVDGRKIANNSTFTHKSGCLEYTCNCHCNGSWSCPGSTARNTCPVGTRDGCNKCIVSETEKYQGESDFVLKQGCLNYKCRCNCDGSYTCPGKDARNVCRGERLGGCRSCEVEKGVVHPGESDFTLTRDCLKYQCRCKCDGSWECPAEKTRNACLGESLGGCRSCRVSDTEVYKGNTDFDVKKGCIHYKCSCNCDGSWSCPGEDARDVCKGEVPGGCRSCKVADNEFHPGNSDFEMVKDCIHYKCRCNCDGGYHCPGREARRVCGSRQGPRRVVTEAPERTQCTACRVSDTEQFTDTSFTLQRGCYRYQCQCNCNGSWECPADRSSNICQTPTESRDRNRCEPCKVGTSVYPGDSSFLFRRRCYQFNCKCNCGGRWTCDHRNPVNVCPRPGQGVRNSAGANSGSGRGSTTRTTYTFYSVSEKGPTGTGYNSISSTDNEPLRTASSQTADRVSTNTVHNAASERGSAGISSSDSNRNREEKQASSSRSSSDKRSTSLSSSSTTQQHSSISSSSSSQTSSSSTSERESSRGTSGSSNSGSVVRSHNPNHNGGNLNPQRENINSNVHGTVSTGGHRGGGRRAIIPGTSLHENKVLTSRVNTSTWVYADGVNRSEVLKGDGRSGGGYSVQIDQKYLPTYEYARNQRRTKAQQLSQLGSGSSGVSGSAGSALFSTSGTSSLSSSSSGSSRSSSSQSGHSESASTDSSQDTGNCQKCLSDSKLYQPGSNFNMRRGCVVYKCLCLCSGSYRCRLVSDNACTTDTKQTTCSNCVYNGMVFPGNMGFTVREGCVEKECDCKCDGTHDCHTSKPINGCQLGVNQGSHSAGSFYPIQAGGARANRGYITNSGRAVYTSKCTNCGERTHSGQGGTVVYHTPVHPASGSRVNTNRHNTNVGGAASTGGSRASGRVGVGVSDSSGDVCRGCMIENELRPGNQSFKFAKDCIDFDCYCACGGAWKCSGRLSLACTPGFGPDKIPANQGCKNCRVQGTEYPSQARFTLRQGCHEYQCTCNCDGSWSCPSQEPRNLCPPVTRPTRGRAIDPQTARGQSYVADKMSADGVLEEINLRTPSRSSSRSYAFAAALESTPTRRSFPSAKENYEHNPKRTPADTSSCLECEVNQVKFRSNSKFMLREGCTQRICDCNCDGTWSCPSELNIDLCGDMPKRSSSDTCEECQIGDETYIGGRDFEYISGCHKYTCECFCNGTHFCPREQVKNICGSNSRRLAAHTELETINAQGATGISGAMSVCKPCEIDGQTIQALGSFVRSRGCVESVCHCQCDGSPSCPPGGAVNVCELPDKKPMGQRPGCKIGRRIHFTRVFAHVEDCIERTCVCHDDGKWSCKRSASDRKVC